MAVATFEFGAIGANPFAGAEAVVPGSGQAAPSFSVGSVVKGNKGSEYVFVTFTPGSNVTLSDGSVFLIDKDFTATLLTTSGATRGCDVGVRRVAESLTSGVQYWFWLQIKGRANVLGSASSNANLPVETTATAGQVNSPATPTATTKAINGLFFLTAVGGGGAAASEANLVYPTVGVTN